MPKIVAYHGNLFFSEFTEHVNEIKERGFDTILFCISETDLFYNMDIFQEFVEYSLSQALACWATYWGLSAGEAICKEGDVEKWLYQVRSIGINDIMIDEPKISEDISRFIDFPFCEYHLCLTDDSFHKMSNDEIKNMPVKSLGVSCYHWVTDWMKIMLRTEVIACRLISLRPDDNFIFIQGFDLQYGMEKLPMVVKDVCEWVGIKDFGFWSFRATAATGTKRSVNHAAIWDDIKF